jgi:hypothetical protein
MSNNTHTATEQTNEKKTTGRPVNPDSKRQQSIVSKKESSTNPIGRPVKQDSARQQKLKLREAMAARGETITKGRPKMTPEQKAQAKAIRDEKNKLYANTATVVAE